MSISLLSTLLRSLAAAVVVAIFLVMWRERRSSRDSWIAGIGGVVLTAWAAIVSVAAWRGAFRVRDLESVPPIGIALVLALVCLGTCLALSPSLRRLLTRQEHLILLNLWRLVGIVFLVLMAQGQMPALWALPAGLGDVAVGVAAPWVARDVQTDRGRRRAVIFNLLGMADLVVAVGLGIMTSPGPAHVFHTQPTSEFATLFPLALVPAFLVPLAFTLHVVSLWQLLGRAWAPGLALSPAPSR